MKLWLSYSVPPPPGDFAWCRSVDEAKPHLRLKTVDELHMYHYLGAPACTNKCISDKAETMPCSKNARTVYDQPCPCPCHRPFPTGSDLVLWMGDNDLFPKLIQVLDENPLRWLAINKAIGRYMMAPTVVRVNYEL